MSSRRPTGSASPRRSRRTPSLALGTNEVNLLELVSAYAPFANGGNGVWPHGIAEIRDSARQDRVSAAPARGSGRSSTPELAGTMNEMLSAASSATAPARARRLPRPAAGKTGTTQEYRDAWFIGYTADLVAGVWLGNDDNTPMNKVTGGSLPAAGLAPLHAGGDPGDAGAAAAEPGAAAAAPIAGTARPCLGGIAAGPAVRLARPRRPDERSPTLPAGRPATPARRRGIKDPSA